MTHDTIRTTDPSVNAGESGDSVADPSGPPVANGYSNVSRGIAVVLCFVAALSIGLSVMRSSRPRSEPAVPAAVAGHLTCEAPVWETGTVDATNGKTLNHTFVIRNTSDDTAVMLSDIQTSCACLVADKPDSIAPSATIELPVTISLSPVPGRFRQNVAILQEGGERLVLTLIGERVVNRDQMLVSFPTAVNFGAVDRSSRVSQTVSVQRADGSALQAGTMVSNDPALRAEFKTVDERRLEIEVELDAALAFATTSRYQATVSVTSGDAEPLTLTIPVMATQHSPFVERVFIQNLEAGEFSDRPILVEGADETGIDRVSFAGDDAISAELIWNDAGVPLVRLSRAATDHGRRLVRGKMVLRMHDNARVFEVPVTAYCTGTQQAVGTSIKGDVSCGTTK